MLTAVDVLHEHQSHPQDQDQSDECTKRTGSFASEVAFAGVQTLTVRPMKACTQREALECVVDAHTVLAVARERESA